MKRATLQIRDVEVGGLAVREVVIDCRHATTTGHAINARDEIDVVRVLAARHGATCRCAAYLLAEGVRA